MLLKAKLQEVQLFVFAQGEEHLLGSVDGFLGLDSETAGGGGPTYHFRGDFANCKTSGPVLLLVEAVLVRVRFCDLAEIPPPHSI